MSTGNAYGYGIVGSGGKPYIEEICVWGYDEFGRQGAESCCDELNDDLGTHEYVVVELVWQPLPAPPEESAHV